MTEHNVLFLDEPTNDWDTQTLSVWEEYLYAFPGVVITVSHDRYFLDRVGDKLLIFSNMGKISTYYGNYSEYLDEIVESEAEKKQVVEKPTDSKPPAKKQTRLSYKDQKEWDNIETDIMELEERIEEIKTEIGNAGSEFEKIQEIFAEQEKEEAALELKMKRWEELALLVEELE